MGLEKRDYMQDRDDPGLAGRWAVMGATHRLIAVNVLVFLGWLFATPHSAFMRDHFTVGWSGVFQHGRVWTLVTAAFSHHDLYHILWNMVYLHWFGTELEQIYGRRNFYLLYFHAAVVSSLAHITWQHGWRHDIPALGASGAVMAIVVVTAIFYPQRTIYMFLVPVPLWLLASFKLLGDLTGMFNGGSGVSHAGHLGGAAAGAFFWWCDLRLFASPGQEFHERPWPGVRAFFRSLWPRRRAAPVEGPRVDGDTALEVDELLRKINREGMASLTPEELAFLKGASDRYKRG